MQFQDLIKNICERGRVSARAAEYGKKLEGALHGFDLVERVEKPEDLLRLMQDERKQDLIVSQKYQKKEVELEDYWFQRYAALQIEWVYQVVNVGLKFQPTFSARAAKAYADILGVKK
jgi:hypothetical protein